MQAEEVPARIVVIEDNVPDVLLIREALQAKQVAHEIVHLRDGGEAHSWAENLNGEAVCPDVIVLDLNIPKASGLDILAAIRRQPVLAKVPVAILTSSVAPVEREQAMRLGADRYLKKPVDLYDFLDQVGSTLRDLIVMR